MFKIASTSFEKEKYGAVVCYPRFNLDDFEQRISELEELHVESIVFVGDKRVRNVPVLGKGCIGIVVLAHRDSEKVALKIRRRDASRSSMQHEAQMLIRANKVNVGPRLLGTTDNFLLMEYIEGSLFPDCVDVLREDESIWRLRRGLRVVLEQAWVLDQIGLDHGELSHAPKHIIVKQDDAPVILDFESASTSRRVSNVTSISQFFFLGSSLAELMQERLGFVNKDKLVSALRAYKRKRDQSNFDGILRVLDIIQK